MFLFNVAFFFLSIVCIYEAADSEYEKEEVIVKKLRCDLAQHRAKDVNVTGLMRSWGIWESVYPCLLEEGGLAVAEGKVDERYEMRLNCYFKNSNFGWFKNKFEVRIIHKCNQRREPEEYVFNVPFHYELGDKSKTQVIKNLELYTPTREATTSRP